MKLRTAKGPLENALNEEMKNITPIFYIPISDLRSHRLYHWCLRLPHGGSVCAQPIKGRAAL